MNDSDAVRVDVVWNEESVNDHLHYVGIWYKFSIRVNMCAYTQINLHTRIRTSPTASPT